MYVLLLWRQDIQHHSHLHSQAWTNCKTIYLHCLLLVCTTTDYRGCQANIIRKYAKTVAMVWSLSKKIKFQEVKCLTCSKYTSSCHFRGGITIFFLLAWRFTTLLTKYQSTALCMNNRQFKNIKRMYTQWVKILMHPNSNFTLQCSK